MLRRLGLPLLAAGGLGSAAALTEVPVDESFVYDGTSSDLAQQFYRLYEAGKSVAQYDFVTTDLPAEVQARLTSEDLTFEELPGLLQRSLLWDSGYTLDSENSFIKVYTVQGVSMGEIAVSLDDYLSAGCTTKNCTDPDGTETFRSETCSGSMMLSVSHCASEQVSKKGGHTSMWATGGDPEDGAPELNMVRHAWYDNVYFQNYIVFAIHTMSNDAEPAWDTCTSGSQYGSIIIPCGIYAEDQAEEFGWESPAQGALTAAWLKRYKEDQPPPFNMLLLLPIAIAFVMLCTGLYMYCRWHRRRSLTKDTFGLTTTPRSPVDHDHAGPAVQVKSSAFLESGVAIQWSFGYPSSSSGLVRALITDPQLREKRIPMDRLVFDREVAKGAFGEVWLCEYDGEVVAVKRLLRNRKHTFDDMQIFMDEIQLTATLDHPNILRFIGVAWNILENLSMVMEYLPNGDLQSYLRKNSEKLTWAVDKHGLAVGIARAIAYLHARKPLLIHRDVKAKNVLLTEEYEAKVIDFGVSRPYGDHSMTVGVGTPFWTAPEVLDGSVYSEKSDIYSFGVVLSELDTGAAPYYDAKTATRGSTLQPFHILKLVMAGCLHPNFSGTCPPRIKQIAELCLQRDPDSRPSAQRVVELLEGVSDIELLEVVGQRDKTDGVRCDAIDEEGKTHSPRSSEPDEGDADSEENPYHEMG